MKPRFLKPLHFCSAKIIPLVFDNSLSYYEQLCAFSAKLNCIIDYVNSMSLGLTEFYEMVNTELGNYVTIPEFNEFKEYVLELISQISGGGVGETIETGTVYTVGDVDYTAGDNAEIFNSYDGDTRNKAAGSYSSASGAGTAALATASHAEGTQTIATANAAHAEGAATSATAQAAHSEGQQTTASGMSSHAEGIQSTASANAAHAEGGETTASGVAAHAEGDRTTASGTGSHAEGQQTTASGLDSHAEGLLSIAPGDYSHAEGYNNKSVGNYSHSEGYGNTCTADISHCEGYNNIISAGTEHSHAEGITHTISSSQCHAEGNHNQILQYASDCHAEGCDNIINGTEALNCNQAHIEGYSNTTISSYYSHNGGYHNTVSASGGAICHGVYNNVTNAEDSSCFGYNNTVSANHAHAQNDSNTASGVNSSVAGSTNTAGHDQSFVVGYHNNSGGANQTVCGKYNETKGADYPFVIGNGSDDNTRSNIMAVDGNNKIIEFAAGTQFKIGSGSPFTPGSGGGSYSETVLYNTWDQFPPNAEITLADDATNYDALIIISSYHEISDGDYYCHYGNHLITLDEINTSISEVQQTGAYRGYIDCITAFNSPTYYMAWVVKFTAANKIVCTGKTTGTWPTGQCGISKIIGIKY